MAEPTTEQIVRELARLLDETGVGEIEIERDGVRVRVARQSQAAQMMAAPAVVPVVPPPVSAPAPAVPGTSDFAKHPGLIASPMVGTAYLAPQPGAKAYVEVGSTVKAGDVLLIIEAMKTMNQIPAPRSGTVRQILIEDGVPVEFGEPLMIVD
jgi:acetyl-CoA carboxylase biotin carboxyl carrier protein